jgi:magnesium-transporting ATPase (P-type)
MISKIRVIVVIALGILFIALIYDVFSGFFIIKHSKNIYVTILGLFIFGVLSLFAEFISGWINKKDDVSHPLYRRVFHLFLLLFFMGAMFVLSWLIARLLGWN